MQDQFKRMAAGQAKGREDISVHTEAEIHTKERGRCKRRYVVTTTSITDHGEIINDGFIDRPAKRQKAAHKSQVPNTAHIPQQLQFIPHPLQQQLNQHQPTLVGMPMPIVTPPKAVIIGESPSDPNGAPVSSSSLFLFTVHMLSISYLLVFMMVYEG